ncbi:MAG: mechanosensitive ion channel family protein [Myxococcales bacterium]|nr:mechanosensitive ion channel family protein [Myxococcales bacterium]
MQESPVQISAWLERYEQWLCHVGLADSTAQLVKIVSALFVIAVLAVAANYIAKKIIVVALTAATQRTKTTWDDALVERKVFHKLSHLAPALVIQFTIGLALYDYSPAITLIIEKLTYAYMVVVWTMVLASFFDALHDIYSTLEIAKTRSIKGYVQLAKIVIYCFGIIVFIAILIEKSPFKLLVGMGASAAILTLVFKDTLLGLVASIQASVNNMVKPGDWIEMPGRGADGTVLEITLNTVKVQNWDRTISTFPTYALISESFTNWQGMFESNGRRIKRAIYIDMHSVKFCSDELLEKLKRIQLVKEHIETRSAEIAAFNEEMGYDTRMPVNGRRLTNLGIFRQYLEAYLQANPNINTKTTYMVRHLQPTERGIPVEIYCFSSNTAWVAYEGIQADLFDHVLASIPEFELEIFQNPSGSDFQSLLPRAH